MSRMLLLLIPYTLNREMSIIHHQCNPRLQNAHIQLNGKLVGEAEPDQRRSRPPRTMLLLGDWLMMSLTDFIRSSTSRWRLAVTHKV